MSSCQPLEQFPFLNGVQIVKREYIYKGMNGQSVERIFTADDSYIFKPLTNSKQFGKELWVYEHILTKLPSIYPKILAHSVQTEKQESWIVLEDLGMLTHTFDEKAACEVIQLMAGWNKLSIDDLKGVALIGPKPLIEDVVSDLFQDKTNILRILSELEVEEASITKLYTLIKDYTFTIPSVLSHGDLHLGNYAYVGNRVVVLDWEHAHLNSPFWDLYHVIDMSHPVFPKSMTTEIRETLLTTYLDGSPQLDARSFRREYYLYSSVFSTWMIALIVRDLENNKTPWSKEQLTLQLMESVTNLTQCLTRLEM
ncbi:phosphotransferase [Peribacillus psychrosaccharolyticus]|uniref:Phosphotransferase n=1 Tax=Peribacillus psychrosaccharolyticus TaxID=1407 RepID=A0A974S0X9_PERPY|nr:phosphotransferase [Peribacillus psychrosaccharolyticus]MEC2057251.1 phosphotransferase [Peribacillus psychrosaccharolyticus]MED3742920.1 phosphotransferase [Peribacillus psychrosaccharolyticus]QQT01014.1 phosphotransferase [Peribacillus psychrosaccharolyticus]